MEETIFAPYLIPNPLTLKLSKAKLKYKIMEDDKFKDIFKEFNPELSSSFQFMTKLEKNMEAMEIVKLYDATQKKRNKIAVALAGVCGFAMGVILTLLYPFIVEMLASFRFTLPTWNASTMTINLSHIGWLLVAAISVLTSLSVYEITLRCQTGSTS